MSVSLVAQLDEINPDTKEILHSNVLMSVRIYICVRQEKPDLTIF